jgi:hypothetical protein
LVISAIAGIVLSLFKKNGQRATFGQFDIVIGKDTTQNECVDRGIFAFY